MLMKIANYLMLIGFYGLGDMGLALKHTQKSHREATVVCKNMGSGLEYQPG